MTVRQVIDEPTSLQMLVSDPRLGVREDCIVCLICGARFRQLTNSHLRAHGTGVAEYRARFGYNRRRALMCRALRRLYTERAVRVDLAGRIVPGPSSDARAAMPGRRAGHRSRGAAHAARGAATGLGGAPGKEGPRVEARATRRREPACSECAHGRLMIASRVERPRGGTSLRSAWTHSPKSIHQVHTFRTFSSGTSSACHFPGRWLRPERHAHNCTYPQGPGTEGGHHGIGSIESNRSAIDRAGAYRQGHLACLDGGSCRRRRGDRVDVSSCASSRGDAG